MDNWIDCDEWIIGLLRAIERKLEIIMWNRNQKEYESPFGNTGNVFKNDVFEVQAYDWSKFDSDEEQEYNFKYNNIKICWYKYLGRGTQINNKYSYEDIINMFNECLKSLEVMDINE